MHGFLRRPFSCFVMLTASREAHDGHYVFNSERHIWPHRVDAIRQCGEPSRMAQNWFMLVADWKARSHEPALGNADCSPRSWVWPPTSSFDASGTGTRFVPRSSQKRPLRCDPGAKGEYKYIGHVRSLYPNVHMARAGGAIPANRSRAAV